MNDHSDVPREYEQVPRELLKHARGRYSHVILVPQPSDSPNDPLNVSLFRSCEVLFLTANSGRPGEKMRYSSLLDCQLLLWAHLGLCFHLASSLLLLNWAFRLAHLDKAQLG
jgi:hypothetical protein